VQCSWPHRSAGDVDVVMDVVDIGGHPGSVQHRVVLGPGAPRSRIISGSGATALEAFSDPELDDGLASDPQPAGFPVKRFDHP
jgi:hypothetical protein